MYKIIRFADMQPNPAATVKFEGEPYGSGVSFFLVHNQPGEGPPLHRHPYSETWIVRAGKVQFTADGRNIDASPGDILVVSPGTAHKFINAGTDLLDMVCIHASPRIIQENLEDRWSKE